MEGEPAEAVLEPVEGADEPIGVERAAPIVGDGRRDAPARGGGAGREIGRDRGAKVRWLGLGRCLASKAWWESAVSERIAQEGDEPPVRRAEQA